MVWLAPFASRIHLRSEISSQRQAAAAPTIKLQMESNIFNLISTLTWCESWVSFFEYVLFQTSAPFKKHHGFRVLRDYVSKLSKQTISNLKFQKKFGHLSQTNKHITSPTCSILFQLRTFFKPSPVFWLQQKTNNTYDIAS